MPRMKKNQEAVIEELRKEKQRLIKIVKRKEEARKKKEALAKEERKLKNEIARLKARGKNNVLAAVGQRVATKENKKRILKAWTSFRKFARKYGD